MKTPLGKLVDEILRALERPEEGFVFDDFDRHYRERERKRDTKSAGWFYQNKASFESIYGSTLEIAGDEPAWVSDGGRGKEVLIREVAYDLDGDKGADDLRERRWQAALRRVDRLAPHCVATLKLIRKNVSNRKESTWELAKKNGNTRKNKESQNIKELARQKYIRDLKILLALFGVQKPPKI